MTILAVEKDKRSLTKLSKVLSTLRPEAELICLESTPAALAAARNKEIDVAFLEVDMVGMSGMLLGQYLKEIYPSVNLIFLTKDRADAFEAMAIRASGCVLMPVSEKSVETELSELRNSMEQKGRSRVFAQTFGNFEFFVDGLPLAFKYTRTKEILAILINNRGAQTTNGEIIASLWEDDGDPEKKMSYLSNLRQDLQNTLTRLQLKDIILKQRGSLAIAANRIECDLYEWLDKKKQSKYQYMGDYMNQYSWAEFVHAELDEISYAMDED